MRDRFFLNTDKKVFKIKEYREKTYTVSKKDDVYEVKVEGFNDALLINGTHVFCEYEQALYFILSLYEEQI